MTDKKLFLLDGHALVYRAHFAFISRPLVNSKGWNVSAIQGFVRFLWDLMQNEKPSHIAVVFDPKGGTFRHEKYEFYKANREAQPEDITFGIPWVDKIVRAMNIPVLIIPNYEADDVIGTLAKQAERVGYTTYMVTPDKDYGQLVSEHILLYKPGRAGNEVEIQGPKEVCERWGINRVEQVVDMLALMGDAVDNIPGLPGIGEKTAAKLLGEFDSLENLLANKDKLKGKQQEIVANHADKAEISKWLATIDINVPVQFDERKFEIEPFNREELIEIFRELEFKSLAESILKSELAGNAAAAPKKANPKRQLPHRAVCSVMKTRQPLIQHRSQQLIPEALPVAPIISTTQAIFIILPTLPKNGRNWQECSPANTISASIRKLPLWMQPGQISWVCHSALLLMRPGMYPSPPSVRRRRKSWMSSGTCLKMNLSKK
jgi:DNA polymerase-1